MERINIYELQKLWEKYPGRSGPRNDPKKKEEKAMKDTMESPLTEVVNGEKNQEDGVPSWWTEMIHENEKDKEKMKKYKAINKKQREEIRNLYAMMQLERESFYEDIDGIEKELEEIHKEKEKWIGIALKFEYLAKQIKRVGISQSVDIVDCFDDIEVPEVSIRIRNKFVPTIETDNIDYTDDEDSDSGTTIGDEPIFIESGRDFRERVNYFLGVRDNNIREWIFSERNNTVQRYEDTTVFPDGPPLPWYEARFPTPYEIDAAKVIQRFYRQHM